MPLRERLREAHPHDVPCIERFDEAAVDAPVADWRRGVVADDQGVG
jgi:periplasmic divalent cation tolerance protein